MKFRKFLAYVVVFVILIAALLAWRASTFHIVNTNPSFSSFPDVMPRIDINFNKTLSTSSGSIAITPNVVKNFSIKGESIHIKLGLLRDGQDYTISITNIHSSGGKLFNKTLHFKPKRIDFKKLPKDVQQAIVASQDPNDASLLTNDPLVSHLPYGDIGYNINYVISSKDSKPALIITISVILAGADYKQSPQALQNTINQREQAALNYIKSFGLDPSKYNIQYSVPAH
jgi:hypothetical protein